MFIKNLIFGSFILALSSLCFGEEEPHHPYLYHLEVNGIESYLLGSAHTTAVSIKDFNPFLEKAVLRSKAVLVESSEFGAGQMPSIEDSSSMQFFRTSDEGSWLEVMRPQVKKRLLNFIRMTTGEESSFNEVLSYLESLKVEAAYTLISKIISDEALSAIAKSEQRASENTQSQVREKVFDEQIVDLADEHKVQVAVLDSPFLFYEMNLGIIELDEVEELLMKALTPNGAVSDMEMSRVSGQIEKSRFLEAEVGEAYENGELVRTAKDNLVSDTYAKRWRRAVLERHKDWFPTLLRLAKQGEVFIAVGLSHVERISTHAEYRDIPRLIEMFEKNGVKVTKVDEGFLQRRRDDVKVCKGFL